MTTDAVITISIILAALGVSVSEKMSIDLVYVMVMMAFMLTGVLTPTESLSGFSNPATLTVAFMFVLSNSLLQSGVIQRLEPILGRLMKRNFHLGLLAILVCTGLVSAFVANTPIVAVFIPLVLNLCHRHGIQASKLLIPLSYVSIIGGMCTLMGTSTNILVSNVIEKQGYEPLSLFASSPMGFILLLGGIIFLLLFSYRLLPGIQMSKRGVVEMRDYLTEIRILPHSPLIGKGIMDTFLPRDLVIDVMEVRRGESIYTVPAGDFKLKLNDILVLRGEISKIAMMQKKFVFEFTSRGMPGLEMTSETSGTSMVELIIPSESSFVGKTLRDLDFRNLLRAIPLAIVHKEGIVRKALHDIKIEAGDIILAEVKTHRLGLMRERSARRRNPYILLGKVGPIRFNARSATITILVMVAIILVFTLQLAPLVICVLAGSLTLVLSRTIRMKDLYEAIEWKIIFMMAGALSMGTAVIKSGLVDQVAQGISGGSEILEVSPLFILAAMYLGTSLLTEVISNGATAAIATPIALGISENLGWNHMPLVMVVLIASSASFMTPVGYQTNTMVYMAGRYRFSHFTRIGIWVNLLFLILILLFIPLIYPLKG